MSAKLDNLLEVMELIRRHDPEMPAQTLSTLLLVAGNPGISMQKLAETLNIASSSTSRNVSALSKWKAFQKPGLDLVEAIDNPQNRREKLVSLTPKGERLVAAIKELV